MDENNDRILPPLAAPPRHPWRKPAAWSLAAALLSGGGWGVYKYGYPSFENNQAMLAQFPALQQSVGALSKRIDTAEERWRSWAAERDSLTGRITRIEGRVSRNAQAARAQEQQMAAQIERRLQGDLDARTSALQTRLDQLEAGQEADRARLGRVQQDVSGMRREVGEQIASARGDATRDFARVDRQMVALDQSVGRGRDDLNALAHRFDRDRIDFEVTKNRNTEIAPGISLDVTHIDVAHRRVNGWLWVLPDRRTVWVRSQGSQQPVVFYSKADEQPHELVITHVTRNNVVGYLLRPARAETGTQTAQNAPARPSAAQ